MASLTHNHERLFAPGSFTKPALVAGLLVGLLHLAMGTLAAAQPVVAVFADPALPPYVPAVSVSGVLDGATGMDSVELMMKAWTDAFRKYHPGADITLVQKDLAPEERIGLGPNTEEVFHSDDGPYEDKYGYQPFRFRICQGAFVLKSHVSAIGVFVNAANPISEVSLAKLDAIYSDARRRGYAADITTWGQLGLSGEWADKRIHIYGFYWRDDVTWYFRDMVDYGAPFKAAYRAPGDDLSRRTPAVARDLMETLRTDPYAIGFGNFSYQADGVKALALSHERGVVSQPALGDMVSGRYPLQRSIYIYVNRKPGEPLSPLLKEFLTFILSQPGQALVPKDHYLPLTAAMAAAARRPLKPTSEPSRPMFRNNRFPALSAMPAAAWAGCWRCGRPTSPSISRGSASRTICPAETRPSARSKPARRTWP